MDERGALLPICTGGHMSDLLIDAQLHFFQKLHDHRVVIKLPSKYHNTIHNHLTLLYSLLLQCLFKYSSTSSSSTLALNFLTYYYCIFLNWDCAKSRSTSKTHHPSKWWALWLRIIIQKKLYINYLSTSQKFLFFGDKYWHKTQFYIKKKKIPLKIQQQPVFVGLPRCCT